MASRGRRHRSFGGGGVPSDEDDDGDDDAFCAFSSKRKKKKSKKNALASSEEGGSGIGDDKKQPSVTNAPAATSSSSSSSEVKKNEANVSSDTTKVLPVVTASTSSTKRHHGMMTDSRKAKMDALLLELEAEKQKKASAAVKAGGGQSTSSHYAPAVPEKKGSYVEPGQEHLTTNLFVGNLAPSITEEELTDLFRQFGDLFSVKIMWPRTQEERNRNRHTGFVCFVNRADAEDAMSACDESDPFNVGRRIMIRWGKNVKNTNVGTATIIRQQKKKVIKQQQPEATTQTRETAPAPADNSSALVGSAKVKTKSQSITDEQKANAIRVTTPKDPQRVRLISTVASFVAKDGALFEQALLEREAGNPNFKFMQYRYPPPLTTTGGGGDNDVDNTVHDEEHIYYRWRVFSFCQGDTFHAWRTDPFVMFADGGRAWIPPPLDTEAARREQEAERIKEESILRQKQERKVRNAKRDYMTGRQLEQIRRGGPDGGARLDPRDMRELDRLFTRQLCASRQAVCEAMAFCFERSGAAKQISSIMKDLLVDASASLEIRIARLYLMSDILFNSQQPGVKNAFLYRDAIERMAPDVFASLGRHGDGKLGRMTMNKLVSAVRTVLNAWADWNVFNPHFLEELFARFEGKEIPLNDTKNDKEDEKESDLDESKNEDVEPEIEAQTVREVAQGTWTTVPATDEEDDEAEGRRAAADEEEKQRDVQSSESIGPGTTEDAALEDADGEELHDDENPDGEPLEELEEVAETATALNVKDADGEPLEETRAPGGVVEGNQHHDADDADGMPLEDGEDDEDDGEADGDPIDEDDVDGELL